ncbi:AraC family transcriptional regulator [Parabacteroides sp. Marseille-P3160]|uniref:AraC family transcriptional regulator n=1 Tax=Parabacteroides sp. Marseille-P3160 TaxID=1917887 RepID=UPI0009BB310A|nr:AraC family transcriptional regulator [Parabacteroides sp. Marseille-P3160]
MSILERKIAHGSISSFSHVEYSQFLLPWHRHEELEIMIFTGGEGIQFVGDGEADYKKGDIALIGSNIPHLHLCNDIATGKKESSSSGEALQFTMAVFPNQMDILPDFMEIDALLRKSQYGIRFYDDGLWQEIYNLVMALDKMYGIERIIQLYAILDKLSKSTNYRLVSESIYYQDNILDNNSRPIDLVFKYLFRHFKEKITLAQIAEYVNQDPSALCRAFKKGTDKSIFRCLAEIRIKHACKLLINSSLSISQIAYECGYGSLSFFNEQFKEIVNTAPTGYKKKYER